MLVALKDSFVDPDMRSRKSVNRRLIDFYFWYDEDITSKRFIKRMKILAENLTFHVSIISNSDDKKGLLSFLAPAHSGKRSNIQ